ncbi:MAG: hypothetical protein A2045_03835 [Rhodocyclales bacterium GWA2_65_20]|nr:MAG: hypothetical protein A2045_03835 [Rhodocyclales bacterium GWA2_65_20]
MFNEFTIAAATAGAWAERTDLAEDSRRLARIISSKAAKLAQSRFLDSSDVACFETIGCHLCWRVGEIRCDSEDAGTVACPLGMDKVKTLERKSEAA